MEGTIETAWQRRKRVFWEFCQSNDVAVIVSLVVLVVGLVWAGISHYKSTHHCVEWRRLRVDTYCRQVRGVMKCEERGDDRCETWESNQ